MNELPAYLRPFVLDVAEPADSQYERVGPVDFYRPAGTARTGAILFVHGGPMPPGLEATPRDWPVFRGYASAAAERGLLGVTVDHGLIRGFGQLGTAADDVEAAIAVLRADRQVDPNRIALWFFSGAGLLAGEWLDSHPEWLRCVLLTYPLLATPPGVDELVNAAEVIGKPKDLPVLLTRVGREREELAGPVAEFVSAGGTALDIIDVPKGQHGFDMLDHTDESRAAVTKALDWAIAHLGEDPSSQQLPIPTPTSTPAARTTATAAAVPATSPTAAAATATLPPPAAPDPAAPVPAPATQGVSAEPASQQTVRPVVDSPAARVVGREHAAYAAHDLEAFLAMYSPTARLRLPSGSELRGRRSLREYYGPRFELGQTKTDVLQRMTLGDWVVEQSIVHEAGQVPTPTIALYKVQEGLIVDVQFLV